MQDKGNTLLTITLYEDGVLMFAPGSNLGIVGDITTNSHVMFI